MKHSFIKNRFLAGVLIIVCFVVTGYALSGTVWSEVKDNTAYVHHDSAYFNCCPEMAYETKVEGYEIDIFERDTAGTCACMCYFWFVHKLEGLEPGTYHARVWEHSYRDYFLAGSTDFTIQGKMVPYEVKNLQSLCGGRWPPGVEESIRGAERLSAAVTSSRIRYVLKEACEVKITVFDVTGARIRDFEQGREEAGEHSLTWNVLDNSGRPVSRGVYFVRLEAGQEFLNLPFIVLR